MRLLVTSLILSAAMAGCDAQQQASAPTPIPDQKLPLPEFFGLYAVDQGKTVPLKNIQQWTAVDISSGAEFIMYDQAAAEKTAKAVLSPVTLDPAVSMSSKGLQWDEQYTEKIPGAPRGFRSYGGGSRIELLRKPVANHNDMIRLVPGAKPEPGFYTLEIGTDVFGVWIDRSRFDDRVAKERAEIKAAMSDPLMSKRQIAFAVIEDLGTLRRQIDELARANNLQKGAVVPKPLLVRKLAGWSTNPLVDPLGNEYGDFVVGRFPSVAPQTKQTLLQLGDWTDYEVLLTHPRSTKPKKTSFDGFHLACQNCKQSFSVRDNLQFDVKQSKILPLTYYIPTIVCPLCHQSTAAEWGYLHGL